MKKLEFLFLFVALAFSCTDQVHDIALSKSENKIQIEDARQLLATENSKPKIQQSNAREEHDRHSIVKNAVWEHAFHLSLSFGDALIVPTKFDEEIYYKPNQNVSLPISSLTYLMFYNDRKDKMHLEVVTSLPSFDKDDTTPNHVFKGAVYVENWQGDYLTGLFSRMVRLTRPLLFKRKNTRVRQKLPFVTL